MRKPTLIYAILALTPSLLAACGTTGSSYRDTEPSVDTIATEAEESGFVTLMSAKGHAFRHSDNDSILDGWYYDDIYLGNHPFLRHAPTGPSTLRLSIFTNDVTADLGNPDFAAKATNLMKPLMGFRRFKKNYEECLGTVKYKDWDPYSYMGKFSFVADYADSSNTNAGTINRCMGLLMDRTEIDAEFKTLKSYGPYHISSDSDMAAISDSMAYDLLEEWRRDFGDDYGIGATGRVLDVRAHVANDKYVTFGRFEHEYSGVAHGIYAETFHTFDVQSGKELTNADIFNGQYLSEVKNMLKDVMAKDPYYLNWHEDVKSAEDVADFVLSDGALTDTGVIFSFQPYEIDAWAAGAYHFIVPYNKLMPFLTPKAKELANK